MYDDGYVRRYNEHEIEAILANMTPEKARNSFRRYSLSELYDIYDAYNESWDSDIRKYASIITEVINEKKAKGETLSSSKSSSYSGNSEFVDMAVNLQLDYLERAKEEREYYRESTYDVKESGLESLRELSGRQKSKNLHLRQEEW